MKKLLAFLLVFSVFLGGFSYISEAEAKDLCSELRVKQSKELDKIVKFKASNPKEKDLKKLEKKIKSSLSKIEKQVKKSCPVEERTCSYPLNQFQKEMTELKSRYEAERSSILANSGGSFGGHINQLLYTLDKKHKTERLALEKKRNSLASTCYSKYPSLSLPNLY